MVCLKQSFSSNQITALLKKDVIVRKRQPWMTIVQFVWPCFVFLLLYTIRLKFNAIEKPDCQFPTRQLPTKNEILPFFHSYICSIENKCLDTKDYEEYSNYESAPLKPIINVAQILINEDDLYNALVELPTKVNFVGAIMTLVTNSRFTEMRENIEKVVGLVPVVEEMIGGSFDIKQLFSDRTTFVKGGQIICGHPFPSFDYIKLVDDILQSQDFSKVNDDELDAMPTPYCKQLYLDVTSHNNGKMTWTFIKPIIHGKILYGPDNNETRNIMRMSNATFEELGRLKNLSTALNQLLINLKTDNRTITEFNKLIELARSPLVASFIGDTINITEIENVMNGIRFDATVADVFQTVKNILECFSVDRFVPAASEQELQQQAFDLNKQRLFWAGVYFNETEGKNVSYKFHMDTDNTPVTFENKNRFWFPGPEASMEEDLKYHRGFAQIKHAIDTGIIKHNKQKILVISNASETVESSLQQLTDAESDDDFFNDWDEDNDTITTTGPNANERLSQTTTEDSLELNDSTETESERAEALNRPKRQLGFLGTLFGGNSARPTEVYDVDSMKVFTKQFPYPSYIKDDFKRGLYLSQAIQMAFFFGLMSQVATCIRHRIWMKESRNTILMRSMGLKASSEITAWLLTTFIEMILIFIAAYIIMIIGGILQFTSFIFYFIFVMVFGLCLLSFCYLCSTLFSSTTTGSVSGCLLFLMTFLPYVIIIYYDAKLTGALRFFTNLTFTSAFSYAWDYVMRVELQGQRLSFGLVFSEGFNNEFLYAFCMMILDTIIYATLGYIIEKYMYDEYKFHVVPRSSLDPNTGAVLSNISKTYDTQKQAVDNVSLVLPRNQITCILGRNGAGKSTIIKMLTGQIKPTEGQLYLTQTSSTNTPEKIGLCSQDNILIPDLTAKEHLEMYAKIKIKKDYEMEVTKTLKSLNFGKYEKYEASQLSGGYQRRLCVAIAFLGSPNLVILDEPCNGIDSKARKYVWDLIKILRKDRAVFLSTHYLDEAEYLSDSITIMHNGRVISQYNSQSMEMEFLKNFEIVIQTSDLDTLDSIHKKSENFVSSVRNIPSESKIVISVSNEENNNYQELIKFLEHLKSEKKIDDFYISSKNLEDLFQDATDTEERNKLHIPLDDADIKKQVFYDSLVDEPLSQFQIVKQLLWKRFTHFSRNYRLLLCVLVLPAIFELLAMSVMMMRLGGEFETVLNLNKDIYEQSTEFLSLENPTNFTQDIYERSLQYCQQNEECETFNNSESVFRWILNTTNTYQASRYGGVTFNESKSTVWYNNKGYHSMMAWLNDLNTNTFQAEMNDSEYTITSFNHPFRLGLKEISTSSILQQAGDAAAALVILIAFSLVIAGCAVYLVNERTSGEKLQQKLCGVGFRTYWGVSLVWDFFVYLIALALCICILNMFNIPVYVDRDNLAGIALIIFLCGFAAIPGVHLIEKLFSESSFAIMTVFCMNLFVAMITLSIIILFDVLGESDTSASIRDFLNRAFLIFPQHALADGIIEICKNYIVAETFKRFDIDSYKSPLTSDLLLPHYTSFLILGFIFLGLNYFIESKSYQKLSKKCFQKQAPQMELKIVTIQNSLKRSEKCKNYSLEAKQVYRAYKGDEFAVKGVSFGVHSGECYGLLGKNGAGKSTIFKMLSGELSPTFGTINFFNREVSYCPQTSAVDPLLSVEEVIKFYGKLRRVQNIPQLTSTTLKSFNLENYRNVLVKNLSGGNRRKLNVAVACIGYSSVVLMDEPTSDMDPITRSLVYSAIKKLLAEQRSVVLTSHTISEIEPICQRIAVLKDGQIIKEGGPQHLKSQIGEFYSVTLYLNNQREDKFNSVKKAITETLKVRQTDIQVHSHSIKFLIKVHNRPLEVNSNTTETNVLSLSELMESLDRFSDRNSTPYTINRCRLDTIFEKILESSDNQGGYVHNGFVDTETTPT